MNGRAANAGPVVGGGAGGNLLLVGCIAPAAVVFAAFWLLPMAWLAMLPASKGWETYVAVLTSPRYFQSLANTLLLSASVTLATLVVGAAVGLFFARTSFPGRRLLLSLLSLPLSFPGVIVGFFMILLGGRQGLIPWLAGLLGGDGFAFAYGLLGLFLAYLYFSLPRAIATYAAAAESMDAQLEEAARSLGASRWRIACDVWLPALAPTTLACGAIVFATAMGAFGTAFTLASKFEVLPITIYGEFTNYANFALAASLSIALGLMTWVVLFAARRFGTPGGGATGTAATIRAPATAGGI
jgi:putative spermidine/putrescine transport system permease protein